MLYAARVTQEEDGRWLVTFRDLPAAMTDGATRREATAEAADCLSEALAEAIVRERRIPAPSAARRGEALVAPEPTVAHKAMLHAALQESGLSVAALARRLGVEEREVRRFLDPRHPTKIPRLSAALAALGRQVALTGYALDAGAKARAA